MESTKIDDLLKDINDDNERRKSGLNTNPFYKQGQIAAVFPSVVMWAPELFCLNAEYYPEETRENLDNDIIPSVAAEIAEIAKAQAYEKDNSGLQRAA